MENNNSVKWYETLYNEDNLFKGLNHIEDEESLKEIEEFKKNSKINFFIYCAECGFDEEEHIDVPFKRWKLTIEDIPEDIKKEVNKQFKKLLKKSNDLEDEDVLENIVNSFYKIADTLRPFITNTKLYTEDYICWVDIVSQIEEELEEEDEECLH